MVVLPVHQGYADIGPAAKFLGRVQSGKTATHDDDVFHGIARPVAYCYETSHAL